MDDEVRPKKANRNKKKPKIDLELLEKEVCLKTKKCKSRRINNLVRASTNTKIFNFLGFFERRMLLRANLGH